MNLMVSMQYEHVISDRPNVCIDAVALTLTRAWADAWADRGFIEAGAGVPKRALTSSKSPNFRTTTGCARVASEHGLRNGTRYQSGAKYWPLEKTSFSTEIFAGAIISGIQYLALLRYVAMAL
jgi:hypothetical protein